MDKLAEKIGMYDFWATSFPGAIGSITLILHYSMIKALTTGDSVFVWSSSCLSFDVSQWIVFVLLSVLFGTLLQEIGRWIRCCRKRHNAAGGLLDPKMNIFTKKEIADLSLALAKYGFNENDKNANESKRLFHSLNIEAQEMGVATRFVKLNVLAKMSLSLAIVMLINGMCFLIETVYLLLTNSCTAVLTALSLCILSFALCVLFVKRSERLDRYWVRNIVYAVSMRASRELGLGKTVDDSQEKN